MEDFIFIIVYILIGLGIFLLFREVNCWYFKINENIELQKKQNQLLTEIWKELTRLKN